VIQLKRILCPVDLSDLSRAALDYATMLARWYDAELTAMEVVWVNPASVLARSPSDECADRLRRFVKASASSLPTVRTVLREGAVVPEILKEATELPADLIVISTHGRGGFDRVILGSVTEKIIRKAACPVFTVPARAVAPAAPPQPFATIICPIDFSPMSMRALKYALSLAQESGKRLVLLHVLDWDVDRPITVSEGPDISAARRHREDEARRELHALVPEEARLWCRCEELSAVGRPYEEILRVAGERGADLIVMGVHGRNSLETALYGSTTTQLVRRAACPVLTIRA
jgi:nucleotide-binding universal stress UspA family protein